MAFVWLEFSSDEDKFYAIVVVYNFILFSISWIVFFNEDNYAIIFVFY